MDRGKRIKIEHEDSSEKIHFPCFDTHEIEKRLVEFEHQIQKLMEIKPEPGINYAEDQINELTNMLSELQKQVLEKDRAVGTYRNSLQALEAKFGELEKEKWMLCEKLVEADVRIKEEMKIRESESVRHAEELGRQKVSVRDLRRRLLEAERAAEVMECQLSKSEQSVKEMKEKGLAAYKAAEVNLKRFVNVLPIAEELCALVRMNVDDLERAKNNFKGLGDPQACKSLELTITKKRHSQETTTMRMPSSTEIIDIIDCDDKFLSCKRGVGAKKSRVNREWMFGADMMRAFQEDDGLCLHAVCELYKQHVLASQCTESSNRRFYHFEALRGVELAGCLNGYDPEHSSVTRSVDEIKQRYPDIVNQCRRIAICYSSYFTARPRTNEPLSRSLTLVCGVREGEIIKV